MPHFDYVITIHNKEDLIERVVLSVLACMRHDGHVYAVADGCTDRTEEILERLRSEYAAMPLTIVREHDVHEIRSINAALRLIRPRDDGYVVSLQDDVILCDLALETKVRTLYDRHEGSLGYVSFRLGANLAASDGELAIQELDLVENGLQPQIPHALHVLPGHIAYRDAAIKSPTCIPHYLLDEIGLLDEDLAPYSWDDHEFSIRALEAGYRNAVFPLPFRSDRDWGGTRRTPHPEMDAYHVRNTRRIREKHSDFLTARRERSTEILPWNGAPELAASA